MHTVIVLLGGVSALMACALLGHAWGGGAPGARLATLAFIPLWFGATAYNLRLGLNLGYSLRDELPINAVVIAIPVSLSLVVLYFLSRLR